MVQMVKRRREISLDAEVIKVVAEKTERGELCLSKVVNTMLRERYKEDLKGQKTAS